MIERGARLGPYEISGPLGAGGMGEVYRARDTRLDRSVAIKVLPSALSSHPELRARFQREAKAISQLNHPNICTLYDVGHHEGTDYLVMELLEGESLADRLARGPLPVIDVLRYGAQIAEALGVAHRQGITHRDLKPGNVMLTKGGAKLLDFGLAKAARAVIASSPDAETFQVAEGDRPLTGRGTILGTFQYMAPEQLEGLEADARTDIFALGSVLYEMVTGTRAFDGKTRTSVIAAIVDRDPPPITAVQPLSPRGLEDVIRTCLSKDPDDRWQSALDVAMQLRRIGSAAVEPADPVRLSRHTRRGWWVAGGALLALLGLLALVALIPGFAEPDRAGVSVPIYGTIPPPPGSELVFSGPGAGVLTISPDGKWMTMEAMMDGGDWRLWLRRVDTGEVRTLPGTEGAEYPFWSPDSRQIGFFSNRKLKIMSVEGGAAVEICDVNEPRGGSWGTGGVILFTPHWRDPIYRVAATGGKPEAVTKFDSTRNETTHRWPLFLPDGRHFLYFAGSHTAEATSGDNAVYLASLDDLTPRLLLRARSNVVYAGGHLLFLRGQKLVAQRFDVDSLKLEGEAVSLADGVRYERGFFQGVFAASENLLVYQAGGTESKSQLNWISRAGEKLAAATGPDVYFDVSIAPNGRVAATAIGDPADLWLFDLERGSRSRFTFEAWQELSPRWSPDSSTLLFWTDRNVQVDTLTKDVGSNTETLLLSDPTLHEQPLDWSRDGRYIAVSKAPADNGSSRDIWIHPTEGGGQPYLYAGSPFAEGDARFSPDGSKLAFVTNETGRDEVYVDDFPRPGRRVLVSSAGGLSPRWRADGRELYYVAPNGAMMAVSIPSLEPFEAGVPQELFRAPIVFAPDPYYDVTGDGQRFLLNQPEEGEEEPLTLVVNWRGLLEPE